MTKACQAHKAVEMPGADKHLVLFKASLTVQIQETLAHELKHLQWHGICNP